MKFIAKTFHGLESVLSQELRELGAVEIEVLKRAVAFKGNKALLYRANLSLRTALRILKPIHTFQAQDENALYDGVYHFDWVPFLKMSQTFAIDSVVSSPHFKHSKYAALKSKDAIVDQFRKRYGRRPSVDTLHPDIRLNVHIFKSTVTLSIDSSGESLHRRGYRGSGQQAPLNEVLAAGMVLLSEWRGSEPFYDAMCGSGTILLEAAMYASNMAPNIRRKRFGFMHWNDFSPELWADIQRRVQDEQKAISVPLRGSDHSARAVETTLQSAKQMGFDANIDVYKQAFQASSPKDDCGTMILNPPYGERLAPTDIFVLYRQIGDHLKQCYAGFDAWILSSNKDALKHIGLRASAKRTLFNGPLECKFQKFSMFKGRRAERQKAPS